MKQMERRLYIYVVTVDNGFAPCPEGRYCTLACCKPVIRKSAEEGDWIVGIGGKNYGNHLKIIYLMKVTKKITFTQYSNDKKFKKRTDNVYGLVEGKLVQIKRSPHNPKDIRKDLSVPFVLISKEFFYFGKNALQLSPKWVKWIDKRFKGSKRGHRVEENKKVINGFVNFVKSKSSPGKHGKPNDPIKFIINRTND